MCTCTYSVVYVSELQWARPLHSLARGWEWSVARLGNNITLQGIYLPTYIHKKEMDDLFCFVDVLTAQACYVGWGLIGVHIIMLQPNFKPLRQLLACAFVRYVY